MRRGCVTQHESATLSHDLETAKSELRQGNFDTARKHYQRILKREPTLTPALHYLGVLEHMDGNSAKGLSLLRRAHQQQPGNYDIRKNLGNILNDMNRCEEAEPLYRALVTERPSDPSNHSNHSVALRKLDRLDEAVASGRQAVKLDPENLAAWLALANALRCSTELEQTVWAYERVIALKRDFSPAHHSLCQTLLRIEQSGFVSRFRLTRTRQAYRRWVDAVPDHPTATFMLDVLEKGRAPARMPDATVKASFDAYADDFDKHIRSLGYCAPERVGEVLVRRLPPANAELNILDAGCGTGLAAPLLRPFARQLVGIDLSTAMLARARATGCYDKLVEVELGTFLEQHKESFDVCVFIDVLIYFGDLTAILLATARALRPGGLIAFTVEKSNRSGVRLHPTGRYSHHRKHVQTALAHAGFSATEISQAHIRNEGNAAVAGLIASAQRPP